MDKKKSDRENLVQAVIDIITATVANIDVLGDPHHIADKMVDMLEARQDWRPSVTREQVEHLTDLRMAKSLGLRLWIDLPTSTKQRAYSAIADELRLAKIPTEYWPAPEGEVPEQR